MYHKIVAVGTLVEYPMMRYLPTGISVTSFFMFTQTGKPEEVERVSERAWFLVKLFGAAAEVAYRRLQRNSIVLIEGELSANPETGGPPIYTSYSEEPFTCYGILAHRFTSLGLYDQGVPALPLYLEDMPDDSWQDEWRFEGRYWNDAHFREEELQRLLYNLHDMDGEVRRAAASYLGKLGGAQGIGLLLEKLNDPYLPVQKDATLALGDSGDSQVLGPLLELLEGSASLSSEAATALGRLGDRRAVGPLIAVLKSEEPQPARRATLRGHVAWALARLGDSRALPPLIDLLRDEDFEVRRSAVSALRQLGDIRAVEPLIQMLQDSHEWVRSTAIDALGHLGDARAADPLIQILEAGEQDLVHHTVAALNRLRDSRAVRPLLRWYNTHPGYGPPPNWVREAVGDNLDEL